VNRLRNEVFRCRLVMLAKIAFQACSFNHSDISPHLESIVYGRVDEPENPNCDTPPDVLRSLTGALRAWSATDKYIRWHIVLARRSCRGVPWPVDASTRKQDFQFKAYQPLGSRRAISRAALFN